MQNYKFLHSGSYVEGFVLLHVEDKQFMRPHVFDQPIHDKETGVDLLSHASSLNTGFAGYFCWLPKDLFEPEFLRETCIKMYKEQFFYPYYMQVPL